MAIVRSEKESNVSDRDIEQVLENYFLRKINPAPQKNYQKFEYDALDLAKHVVKSAELIDEFKTVSDEHSKSQNEHYKSQKEDFSKFIENIEYDLNVLQKELYETKDHIKTLKTISIIGFSSLTFVLITFIMLYMIA